MNHLLYNISVIAIILGIIIVTNSITVADTLSKINNKILPKKKYNMNVTVKKDIPSKVFDKMFDSPSVWMGYSDTDSREFIYKNN